MVVKNSIKFCSKCKQFKELKLFDNRKFSDDGRSDCCSQCITEHLSKYYFELEEKTHKTKQQKCQEYQKIHRKNNINYKISCNLRSRIYSQVKSLGKSDSTLNLLGCSIFDLRKHLESKFKKGMNWNNYGTGTGTGINGKGMKEWHIDHIKPCICFELHRSEEQRKCFHYTNLQPLWAKKNLEKGSKY